MKSLLALKPKCHLIQEIPLVASSIGFLGIINVQPLGSLSVISVSRATRADGLEVMLHGVELGDIEVLSTLQLHEDLLELVERIKTFLHGCQRRRGVDLVLSIGDEVENGGDDTENIIRNGANH
jgi:hypothetical protein